MAFLTDLTKNDRVELKFGEHVIVLRILKRTGSKTRLSICADRDVKINKLNKKDEILNNRARQ